MVIGYITNSNKKSWMGWKFMYVFSNISLSLHFSCPLCISFSIFQLLIISLSFSSSLISSQVHSEFHTSISLVFLPLFLSLLLFLCVPFSLSFFPLSFLYPHNYISLPTSFALYICFYFYVSLSLSFLTFLYQSLHSPISSVFLPLFLSISASLSSSPFLCISLSPSLFHSFEVPFIPPFFTCGCGLYHEPRRTVNNNLK